MTRKTKPRTAFLVRSSAAEYLTFVAASGGGGVEAVYADENVWLSQKMMAQLYDVEVPTINYHLKKVFLDSELEEGAVLETFELLPPTATTPSTTTSRASSLSGTRVNSERAVQFRKWATRVIEEFTSKGFAMDDERLKRGGSVLSDRYFEEQLQRLREIRISERKFYQKITDIYATSVDYDVTATATKQELLDENALAQLSRIVNAYLDVAEDMALRKIPMTMQDWEVRLSHFLAATDREVLSDAGKVTAEIANAHAESEFEKYRIVQDRLFQSDFDRVVAETKILAEKAGAPRPRKSTERKKP